ncbi:MAG: hypothetical protein WAW13_02100 [Minisyncoccia bacterium]
MAKLETVEVKAGGGGGFGEADTSDDLRDMGNYESAIMNEEIFKMMAKLKVFDVGGDRTYRSNYQYLTLDKTDIEDLKAESMGAAGHGINSQFACIGTPFRAIPFSDSTVEVVERIVTKGKRMGKTIKEKKTNSIKIYRTGTEFDDSLYAVKGWGNVNKDGEELVYENFTKGQELRAAKILADMDEKLLKSIGVELGE